LSTAESGGLKKLFDAFEAEFSPGSVVVGTALEYAAGDQEQCGAFLQPCSWRVKSRVRKQPKGEAGGGKLSNSSAVAEQSWCVSRVGVTQSAEFLVVASDESRAGAHAAGGFEKTVIEAETEFGDGVGFVEVLAREEFLARISEDLLRGGENAASFIAPSGGVEQAEQNALRTDPNRVIEIPGDALANENGRDVGPLDFGEDGRNRLNRRGWRRSA